jgi:hypothetical protein
MNESLCVILILIIIIYGSSSIPPHCLIHRRHHQPSTGHYLLRIEQSIDNEHTCEHKCSMDHSCSMATFHQRQHRCHLFQHNHRHSLSHPHRSNYAFSTFDHCPGRFSSSHTSQTRVSNVHCNYDS